MSSKAFSRVAGLVFLLVAIAHLLRAVLGWSVFVDGWAFPMWLSVLAIIAAGFLAFEGLRRRSSSARVSELRAILPPVTNVFSAFPHIAYMPDYRLLPK